MLDIFKHCDKLSNIVSPEEINYIIIYKNLGQICRLFEQNKVKKFEIACKTTYANNSGKKTRHMIDSGLKLAIAQPTESS